MMKTDLIQRRRLSHLESRFESLWENDYIQALESLRERLFCILNADEIGIYKNIFGQMIGIVSEQEGVSVDLSGGPTESEVCAKLDADPEYLRLIDEFRTLYSMGPIVLNRLDFDSAQNDFKLKIFFRRLKVEILRILWK